MLCRLWCAIVGHDIRWDCTADGTKVFRCANCWKVRPRYTGDVRLVVASLFLQGGKRSA